jgi:hypothetical protein
VLLADCTVAFGDARSPGSMLTIRLCRRHGRPYHMIPPDAVPDQAAGQLRARLDEHRITTLNAAGNRASQAPEIAQWVRAVLELALGSGAQAEAFASCSKSTMKVIAGARNHRELTPLTAAI